MKKIIGLVILFMAVAVFLLGLQKSNITAQAENAITYIEIHDMGGPIFIWGSPGQNPATPTTAPTVTNTPTPKPTLPVVPPTPTPPDPGATDTPEPEPSVTPEPEPTLAPTPGGNTEIAPFPDAPACAAHDDRAFHTLWNAEAGCHYDHFHGQDPHIVDDVFGTGYFRTAGGEISYPWQTPNENAYKHAGYVWLVEKDLPCTDGETDGCVTDFRAQFHGLATVHGAVTNFHSAALQARVCSEADPTRCGTIHVGFIQGPVDLVIGPFVLLDRPDSANRIFLHQDAEYGDPSYGTWYTAHRAGIAQVVPQFEDMWEVMPRLNDTEAIVAGAQRLEGNNGSAIETHIIQAGVNPRWKTVIGTGADNRLYFEGYMYTENAFVAVAPQDQTWHRGYRLVTPQDPVCAGGPSANCYPLVINGVPAEIGLFQYRGTPHEFDIFFNGQSANWITYPNIGP